MSWTWTEAAGDEEGLHPELARMARGGHQDRITLELLSVCARHATSLQGAFGLAVAAGRVRGVLLGPGIPGATAEHTLEAAAFPASTQTLGRGRGRRHFALLAFLTPALAPSPAADTGAGTSASVRSVPPSGPRGRPRPSPPPEVAAALSAWVAVPGHGEAAAVLVRDGEAGAAYFLPASTAGGAKARGKTRARIRGPMPVAQVVDLLTRRSTAGSSRLGKTPASREPSSGPQTGGRDGPPPPQATGLDATSPTRPGPARHPARGEPAVLVTVDFGRKDAWDAADRLAELRQLAVTAGAVVKGETQQRRPQPDPALLVGSGKADEIAALVGGCGAELVILDSDLSPGQQRNLEERMGVRVVDRTQLILDIFARRAASREGQLQVELAQLRYLLPRLTGRGTMLSRLGGGIGTRGPGETKLEVDRRRVRQRIQRLETDIASLERHRALGRRGRRASELPLVCLVGYTNAGKSTLLNALTGAGAFVEDLLFATLDPLTRVVEPPQGPRFLLTDTVGFIRGLPHHLVAAFRATLEEVVEADLLLQVIDASHPRAEEQQEAVRHVLVDLEALEKPAVVVLNKVDLIEQPGQLQRLKRLEAGSVAVSALRGDGLPELLEAIGRVLASRRVRATFRVPYGRGGALDTLHRRGRVIREEFLPGEVEVEVEIDPAWAERVRRSLQ